MVIIFALLGALVLGLLVGLSYRGFVMFGDRRHLDVLTEQLQTEHRMSMATTEAIARMRGAVREHLRGNRSA
ncbi:hypothetical protein [uncultured Nocardioides sp.]|uniref:hypothetical protein n=1 Tax=uncultured Nocardioides sp. TaxID=198441 RepID=UPI002611C394|nr:hypothetical protein [uncultured Nocardioides sp.]